MLLRFYLRAVLNSDLAGTGDQLESTKEVVPDDKKERHPTVEKKSRLTDLVKNSKQLLSKYILNDNIRHDNPEDDYAEKVLKVTKAYLQLILSKLNNKLLLQLS